MWPGLELKIEGIEVDTVVDEAVVALIEVDMEAAEADAAGEDSEAPRASPPSAVGYPAFVAFLAIMAE